MVLGRAATPKKSFDALRSELDSLREDFGSFVSTLKDNGSSRAELDGIRERIATLSNDCRRPASSSCGNWRARSENGRIRAWPSHSRPGSSWGQFPFGADAPSRVAFLICEERRLSPAASCVRRCSTLSSRQLAHDRLPVPRQSPR
jgi:hypothetical protein